jgi:hypothetical protein
MFMRPLVQGGDRDRVCLAATIGTPRDHDRELAVIEPRACGADFEGAVQSHGACETAELTLDEVIRRPRRQSARRFFAGDDDDPVAEQDANRIRGHACDIEDDFHRVGRFENVEDGVALTREHAVIGGEMRVEIGEQLPDVVSQFAQITGGGTKGNWATVAHHRTRATAVFRRATGRKLRQLRPTSDMSVCI